MVKKFNYQGVTWLDLTAPTKAEVDQLVMEYKIHPLVAGELLTPSLRSKVDVYDNFIYLILHFPTCELCYGTDPNQPDAKDTNEIDFIVGEDFLITTHYDAMPALEEFSHILDLSPNYRTKGKTHAGHLLFSVVRRLYQSLEEGLLFINQSLKKAEANIFAGREKEMVKALSEINRSLLDFRWSLKAHSDVLNSFDAAGRDFFGDTFSYYLRAISGEYEKIWNMLESNRETFTDLRQTNESLLSIKTNDIMKLFTILAFIGLPLSAIPQIFGMNTVNNPLIGHPYDFWSVLVIIGAVVSGLFAWFRFKRWL